MWWILEEGSQLVDDPSAGHVQEDPPLHLVPREHAPEHLPR